MVRQLARGQFPDEDLPPIDTSRLKDAKCSPRIVVEAIIDFTLAGGCYDQQSPIRLAVAERACQEQEAFISDTVDEGHVLWPLVLLSHGPRCVPFRALLADNGKVHTLS
jgi:hypothetical protein